MILSKHLSLSEIHHCLNISYSLIILDIKVCMFTNVNFSFEVMLKLNKKNSD